MKKYMVRSSALVLGMMLGFSGCGSDDANNSETPQVLELESDGKSLVFYSASANTQYAYDVDSAEVLDLQGKTNDEGEDISTFNLQDSEKGKLFKWVDSQDGENKIVMLKQDYKYSADKNITSDDFFYIGHFHHHSGDDYDLTAESNRAFDGVKLDELKRLNTFMAEQNSLEQNLSTLIPSAANGLCGFHTFEGEEGEKHNYVIGQNGVVYVYDAKNNNKLLDSVAVTDSCTPSQVGMSSTEDGVLFFLANTQKVYSVDSHGDGVYHVHVSYKLSELLGDGKTAEMMVGIEPLKQ